MTQAVIPQSSDEADAGVRNGRTRLSALEWAGWGPFLAQLVVIRYCNLSCGYCNEYDKTSSPIPYDVLDERLQKLRDLGTWMVCFTGGEPSLHPDIVRLVERARQLGFRRRQMITNGYRLTEKLIRGLNDAGLTDLQISIDGVRPNDTTVKVLKPLRGRLERLARTAKFDVVMSGVIGSAPPDEPLEVIRFAKENGFQPRVLLLHDGDGRVGLGPEDRKAWDDAKREIGRPAREARNYREKLARGEAAPFRCRSGSRYLYVDEFGKVRWCSQMREAFGKNLLEYSLKDLKEQFHTAKPCADFCGVGCARSASAYDEWRGQPLTAR